MGGVAILSPFLRNGSVNIVESVSSIFMSLCADGGTAKPIIMTNLYCIHWGCFFWLLNADWLELFLRRFREPQVLEDVASSFGILDPKQEMKSLENMSLLLQKLSRVPYVYL